MKAYQRCCNLTLRLSQFFPCQTFEMFKVTCIKPTNNYVCCFPHLTVCAKFTKYLKKNAVRPDA